MDKNKLVEFLLTGSRTSLRDAFLARLSEERNKQKEIGEALEAWAEAKAQLIALEFFLAHGEEVAAKLSKPPQIAAAQPFALPKAFNRPRSWRKCLR